MFHHGSAPHGARRMHSSGISSGGAHALGTHHACSQALSTVGTCPGTWHITWAETGVSHYKCLGVI